jgi:diaminohydroxyphosphoribosylaminopyrimidine deaminase/5-amino-6-(5-phosphoribosylamino)uracil reductase
VQISNEQSSHFVHVLRSRSDAIMVGVGTILNDDPRLTVRGVHGDRLDQIYILDSAARTPPHAKLFGENGWVTICFSSTPGADEGAKFERLSALTERFQTTSYPVAGDDEGRLRLEDLFSSDYLSETHILVEPGPTLAASFFATNLWDRLIVIEAPAQIADRTAPSAAAIPEHARATATLNLAGDTLTEYLNTRSPAFFAAVPSADFVLAAEEVGSSVA